MTNTEALRHKLGFLRTVAGQIERELEVMEERQQQQSAPARAGEIERSSRPVSRAISDTQRLRLSFDFVFLSERGSWLTQERERLKKKYNQLLKEINKELEEVEEEKERLRLAIRYGIIEEPQPTIEQAEEQASAPTSLMKEKDAVMPRSP